MVHIGITLTLFVSERLVVYNDCSGCNCHSVSRSCHLIRPVCAEKLCILQHGFAACFVRLGSNWEIQNSFVARRLSNGFLE